MARMVEEKGKSSESSVSNTTTSSNIHPEDAIPSSKWTPSNGHHDTSNDDDDDSDSSHTNISTTATISPDLLPSGLRSLSGIAFRSFLLGSVLTVSACTSLYLLFLSSTPHPIWRAPLFFSLLALFHFLEFLMTAQYNTRLADITAFLFSHNGAAYHIAHGTAMAECIITSLFFPAWQARVSNPTTIALGLVAVLIGQAVRSLAMATAGTNFNHLVQTRKRGEHVLVTGGIYAWSRHPSYFGFFWWGLGTQLMLGNAVSLAGYAWVLWTFFSRRIRREEEYLVAFFGEEYVAYRKRTGVGIPFLR